MRLAIALVILWHSCQLAVADPADGQVSRWVQQLDDESFEAREKAATRLFDAGTLAVSTVIKAMKNSRPEIRTRAHSIVKRWVKAADPSVFEALCMAVGDEAGDEAVRAKVLNAIHVGNWRWLEEVGAAVEDDFDFDFGHSGNSPRASGADPQVRSVSFVGVKLNDTDLLRLTTFKSIQSLNLSGTNVSDSGLYHLRELKSLKKLQVDRTSVTDAGLVHILGLPLLTHLNLAKTRVSDIGLVQLTRLGMLNELNLNSTKITDKGLSHLHGMESLRMLHFQDTEISAAGLDPLRLARPKLMTSPMFLGLDRGDLGPNSKRFK